ncbi:MAG: hypothetical protein SFU83_00530 [Meiothermus sp.]|nr:hypothetical protein [Meiothermus sp.]
MRVAMNFAMSILLQAAGCGLMVSVGVTEFPALLLTALVAGGGPIADLLMVRQAKG